MTDTLPQYAGLFAEWPELAPRMGRLTLRVLPDVGGATKAMFFCYPSGEVAHRADDHEDELVLALCRSAAEDWIIKQRSWFSRECGCEQHNEDGTSESVLSIVKVDPEGEEYFGPTYDHALIAALRAVRGEGK